MSTVDLESDTAVVHTKGAPETVLPCCTRLRDADGHAVPLDAAARARLQSGLDRWAASGLRVLAIGRGVVEPGAVPSDRGQADAGSS